MGKKDRSGELLPIASGVSTCINKLQQNSSKRQDTYMYIILFMLDHLYISKLKVLKGRDKFK